MLLTNPIRYQILHRLLAIQRASGYGRENPKCCEEYVV